MTFTIPDKEDFLNNFLTPLSRVADSAVLKINENSVSTIITTSDNTLVVHATYNKINSEKEKNLNIPDLKRLCRVLSCIEEKSCTFDISSNYIGFESTSVRFKYHLYEDNIIKTPKQINFDKLKQLPFDGKFNIPFTSVTSLIKGSSIATETNKLYLSFKGSDVMGELTDKTRANTDSYGIKIADDYTGEQINTYMPLNFELFRIISCMKFKSLATEIAAKRGLLTFDTGTETSNMKFIVSALQN
jgi:DNA-binding Xre family transcriptional regulator